MEKFADFLKGIDQTEQRDRTEEVINWVQDKFPKIVPEIKYNKAMFTDHGTFIIAFSIAKNNLAPASEKEGIKHFSDEMTQTGYTYTENLMKIPWTQSGNYTLLEKMIQFNISDKKERSTFGRK